MTLANGVEIPLLGFGTWELPELEGIAYRCTRWALDAGYRHVDTAQAYRNERAIGRALRDSGLPRDSYFITMKLSRADEFASLRTRFDEQLIAMDLDHFDAYLLHTPGSSPDGWRTAWRQLEELYDEGRVRALGVSNFDATQLLELWEFARVQPVYVQQKFSIYHPGGIEEARSTRGHSLMEQLSSHGLAVAGVSVVQPEHSGFLPPLGDPHVLKLAARIGRTPSQVLHRWLLQLGTVVLPRSRDREHIVENSQLFGFSLAESDMRLLNGIVSLAASSPGRRSPAWVEDVYGLSRLSTGQRPHTWSRDTD